MLNSKTEVLIPKYLWILLSVLERHQCLLKLCEFVWLPQIRTSWGTSLYPLDSGILRKTCVRDQVVCARPGWFQAKSVQFFNTSMFCLNSKGRLDFLSLAPRCNVTRGNSWGFPLIISWQKYSPWNPRDCIVRSWYPLWALIGLLYDFSDVLGINIWCFLEVSCSPPNHRPAHKCSL